MIWEADDPWAEPDFLNLAQAMTAPIRRRLNIARKCFSVQEIPKGALPLYDKDDSVRSHIWTP